MFQRKIRAKDKEKNPERLLQLKRICDMLIAAGYFRARVPVLSPFDKVVGGLVWGITASNVDLDVDIIFQEKFGDIGRKLAWWIKSLNTDLEQENKPQKWVESWCKHLR